MDAVTQFYFSHPFWVWLAIAAIFLIAELPSGTGWLLWPAGSAALVGIVTAFVRIGWQWELVLFAATTVITTFLGRRFMPRTEPDSPDINDQLTRLVGHHGLAAGAFKDGRGRLLIDGKEWTAELEGDSDVAKGQKLEVIAILGGARLRVRAE